MSPQATRAAAERLSADERREQILIAAISVFAEDGYAAASTEEIARRAGISQPYLFRLFGTKRDLVLAVINRCFAVTEATFERAAQGTGGGEEAMHAMGFAYMELIQNDHAYLRAQLHAYAACEDPVIRDVVARNYGHLVDLVQRISGADSVEIAKFFATGMLLNVLAMIGQFPEPQPWAMRLLEGCTAELMPAGALATFLGRDA